MAHWLRQCTSTFARPCFHSCRYELMVASERSSGVQKNSISTHNPDICRVKVRVRPNSQGARNKKVRLSIKMALPVTADVPNLSSKFKCCIFLYQLNSCDLIHLVLPQYIVNFVFVLYLVQFIITLYVLVRVYSLTYGFPFSSQLWVRKTDSQARCELATGGPAR